MKIKITAKTDVLTMAKEVREVTDVKEAARLVQSDNWVIVSAVNKEDGIMWVLINLGDRKETGPAFLEI